MLTVMLGGHRVRREDRERSGDRMELGLGLGSVFELGLG